MMEAGRELDALVAEKVMGWKRMTYAESYRLRDPKTHGYANDHRLTMYWHTTEPLPTGYFPEAVLAEDSHDYYNPQSAWSPSTSIEDAWDVKEVMRKRGFYFHYDEGLHGLASADFYTVKASVGLSGRGSGATAKTAPHAICLAALKAVGVNTDYCSG